MEEALRFLDRKNDKIFKEALEFVYTEDIDIKFLDIAMSLLENKNVEKKEEILCRKSEKG